MGEFLRSAYAKRLVNLSQVHLRTKTLYMHQWGVNLPGACEALCHWRGTIEPLVLNGTIEPLVAADLDLVNMFGNAECPIFAPLCALISLRRRLGPNGSISPTLLPHCPPDVSSPLIAAQSRATYLAPSRALLSWRRVRVAPAGLPLFSL